VCSGLLAKEQMFEHMPTMTVPSASGEVLPEALAEIFREHYQLIYRTAFSVTGRKQDAEDVLRTMFLRLTQFGERPESSPPPKNSSCCSRILTRQNIC
jgi:DNA-directed RNA polymerase specialized sigma24 family protein